MKSKIIATFFLTLFSLMLGYLVTIQYQTHQATFSDLSTQSRKDLIALLSDVNERRITLTEQDREIRYAVEEMEKTTVNETVITDALLQEQQDLLLASGYAEVKGNGILLTINHQKNLIAVDFVDIINEIWGSGAEAITVNDIRITSYSGFTTKGEKNGVNIYLNDTPLSFPVSVEAMGNPDTLKMGLTFPGSILDKLTTTHQLDISIIPQEEIVIEKAL